MVTTRRVLHLLAWQLLLHSAHTFTVLSSRGDLSSLTPASPTSTALQEATEDASNYNEGTLMPDKQRNTYLGRRQYLSTTAAVSMSKLLAAPAAAAATTSPTHVCTFAVRIARSDGSFYVRDDDDEDPVYQGRLRMDLWGQQAPQHVEQFLSYCSDTDDGPSYARSMINAYNDATGVVTSGYIPGLDQVTVGSGNALQYRGKLRPAVLWRESTSSLPHNQRGLLSHANLDVTPSFSITTRSDTTELDGSHTVFGRVGADAESIALLRRLTELPVYRSTAVPATTSKVAVAGAVYDQQRQFFQGLAQAVGDDRGSKIFPGKLLRRVEVTKVNCVKL